MVSGELIGGAIFFGRSFGATCLLAVAVGASGFPWWLAAAGLESTGDAESCSSSDLAVLCAIEPVSVELLIFSALRVLLKSTRSSSSECSVELERSLEKLGVLTLLASELVECSASESLTSDSLSLEVGLLEHDAGFS